MEMIKRKAKHFWSDHKIEVVIVAVILAIAIIM